MHIYGSRQKFKDNKGFSLVELIVVIAIMAVLTAVASLSIASVLGVSVKQCAREIKSSINETRVSTMGKDKVTLEIVRKSDGYYCTTTETDGYGNKKTPEEKKVGRSNLDVSYVMTDRSGNSTEKSLEAGDTIIIEFDRASGAMKYDDTSGKCCTQIKIKKNSTEKILTLYPETGKVSMN